MSFIARFRSEWVVPGFAAGKLRRWLERRIARVLIETQARLFVSWLEHELLKTVGKVVCAPVTAPYKSAMWMFEKIHEEVEGEQLDEDRVKSRLMELQLRYEIGEVEEEEYLEQEEELMERLAAIRKDQEDERYEPDEAWWRRTFPDAFEKQEEGESGEREKGGRVEE